MSAEPVSPREREPRVLEIRGLRVVRGGKAIVRGVDLEARPGDIVGILGPSGAGKSTLFRAIVGELPTAAGTVRLANDDVGGWPLWRRARAGIGYIPQTPSVLWDLTVRGNLEAFFTIVHGRAPSARDVESAAVRVDLEARLDVTAGELSAGERRRLEFARAITRTPRVLICDEPFAGIDPAGAERLAELLRSLATGTVGPAGPDAGGSSPGNVAVLLADHHVAEALHICTRAVLLLDGTVAASADPEGFREHPLVQGRYLGSWQRSIPPPPPR